MNATTIKTVHGWCGIESWHAAILDGTDIVWQSWTDYTDQERAYNVSLDKLKELTP